MSRCENCIIKQLNSLKALDKQALKSISDSKESRSIKKGDSIFEEGERLNGVFCIREGTSKITRLSSNGKTQILKLAKKGDVLGRRSLVLNESAGLSAIALNNMEVCFIPKSKIQNNIDGNIKFAKELLREFARDLKVSNKSIVDISQSSVKQRVAQVLLYIKKEFGENNEGLKLNLSRRDLSEIVGAATEACSRAISDLKSSNIIALKGKRIKIVDLNRLQLVAN